MSLLPKRLSVRGGGSVYSPERERLFYYGHLVCLEYLLKKIIAVFRLAIQGWISVKRQKVGPDISRASRFMSGICQVVCLTHGRAFFIKLVSLLNSIFLSRLLKWKKRFHIKKANKSKFIKDRFAKSINITTLRVNRTILKQIGESLRGWFWKLCEECEEQLSSV